MNPIKQRNEKVQAVKEFLSRLESVCLIKTHRQIAADAEKREKPLLVTYKHRPGAALRARLNLPTLVRMRIAGFIFLAYFVGMVLLAGPKTELLVLAMLLAAGPLFAAVAYMVPEDSIYLDRLGCMIPSRDMVGIRPRLLWSKLEQVDLVDTAKPGKRCRLALRLKETSDDHHDILLDGLAREDLDALVQYIQQHAPQARGMAQLKEIQRFHDYQKNKLENVSYTQLWESSCTAQFGLTSFTPLSSGVTVQDQYKVVRQIAAGGFSAIYLIEDGEGQQFVLKESVLPPNLDETLKLKATEQFQREAMILAKMNHAQIARVYDHFVENGRNYLRMEYINGVNMRKYIADEKIQPETVAVRWSEQLAGLLAYLHGRTPPVVHRDLSPDNILVRADGKLVLIDFGAANEFVGAATGTLVGKHAYMSPEQIRGSAEPISDIYSLGACAYFAVTGRDPEPIRTASAQRDGANVSQWFDQFISKCTQLDKGARLQNAQDCLAYLSRSTMQAD